MAPERAMVLALFLAAGALFVRTGLGPLAYGRHAKVNQGGVPIRLAWMLMGAPGLLLTPWLYLTHGGSGVPSKVMLTFWVLAYAWRGVVYPLLIRGTHGKRMPWSITLTGLLFSTALAYATGMMLSSFAPTLRWLWTLRFLYGTSVFLAGMLISRAADIALAWLRRRGDMGYMLPRGPLFGEISCPNYLGEMFMWLGWAVLTWSSVGLAAATLAFSLLLPRAVSHHLWYRRTFPNYPPSRRAIVPFVL
ncbi:MAG: hypothetical protein AAGA54_10980 [Myxococcota bacterium]